MLSPAPGLEKPRRSVVLGSPGVRIRDSINGNLRMTSSGPVVEFYYDVRGSPVVARQNNDT